MAKFVTEDTYMVAPPDLMAKPRLERDVIVAALAHRTVHAQGGGRKRVMATTVEYVDDADAMAARPLIHDCPTCRASQDQAVAVLREGKGPVAVVTMTYVDDGL